MSDSSADFDCSYWQAWESQSLGRVFCELVRCRRAFLDRSLSRYAFGTAQLPVLAYLWAGKVGSTQKGIAEGLALDRASVTRAVQLLEDLGLVERRTQDGDGRARQVWLTRAGRKLAPEVAEIAKEWHSLIVDGWTEHQQAVVLRALRTMLDRANAELERQPIVYPESSITHHHAMSAADNATPWRRTPAASR